jgi:uncharacterized metal-binding protein YceD (DUF177 family)
MTAPDDKAPVAVSPLDWTVRVEDVPERGFVWRVEATPAERARLVAVLQLTSLPRLIVEGRIDGAAGGVYRLKGRLMADVVQACVVSLDPVSSRVDEPLSIEFRPPAEVGDELATTPDYNVDFDVEPIVRGHLETGRVVYEQFSASLDPYPRASGAGTPIDLVAKPSGAGDANPFAVLANFKKKS